MKNDEILFLRLDVVKDRSKERSYTTPLTLSVYRCGSGGAGNGTELARQCAAAKHHPTPQNEQIVVWFSRVEMKVTGVSECCGCGCTRSCAYQRLCQRLDVSEVVDESEVVLVVVYQTTHWNVVDLSEDVLELVSGGCACI